MNIFKLSLKNIFNKPLSSSISLALLILGIGIISLLLQLNTLIKDQMDNNLRGIEMVVGAKGSPLQLILSSVYHIDSPTGNISLEEAEEISKNRMVGSSIKLLYGDNYKGYRIVGAEKNFIDLYKGIIKKVINFFKTKGSKKNNIIAAIGPCISVKSYEIKKNFLKKFLKLNKKNKIFFKFKKKRISFDLKKYIIHQLKKEGIKKIDLIKKDTYKLKNTYFSARRSLKEKNNDYGRNISLIMIN